MISNHHAPRATWVGSLLTNKWAVCLGEGPLKKIERSPVKAVISPIVVQVYNYRLLVNLELLLVNLLLLHA
jgi:hypothetical protein